MNSYEQINLRYIAPIPLMLLNQSIPLQITDTTDRQHSVPSAARSTDCVIIASVVSGSGQTGNTSGKC
jgi:hypothetical protein